MSIFAESEDVGSSSNDSVVNTVIAGIKRLEVIHSAGIFHIHFVGSEETECSARLFSPANFQHRYHQLLTFLQVLGYTGVSFLFTGPNIDIAITDRSFTFVMGESSGLNLFSVNVLASSSLYHELPQSIFHPDMPLLVVLLNAGIWGYESWHPSLRFMQALSRRYMHGMFCVLLTAYTLLEAEDDYDCIENLFNQSENSDQSKGNVLWYWECELNPFRSFDVIYKATRPVESVDYFQNNYWSCFHFVQL